VTVILLSSSRCLLGCDTM